MKKLKGLRWWVVSLVALAAVINYIDRQAFGALWPDIASDLFPEMNADETKTIYGTISAIFILSYAAGQTIFGKIFDWIGTRIGFAISIGVWSVATMIHAFAKGIISFSVFRSILGIAEAGNWPGAAKANAEWFPTKERAFAQGIFNSGAAIGGIVAYPIIGLLAIYLSWQSIFLCVGLIGFLWLLPWFYIVKSSPEKHPWLSENEKNYILSGQRNQDIDEDGSYDEGYSPKTAELLGRKESWGVIIASAAIDPIWWLFIVWIPIYLNETFGMNVKDIAFSAWVPYVGAMLGAWFGGLLAQNRLTSGWSVNRTRKMVITLGCLIMVPCFLLLRSPGGPTMLSMFGVKESTALTMVEPDVKEVLNNKTLKTLFNDSEIDVVSQIKGKSADEIMANSYISEAISTALERQEIQKAPSKITMGKLAAISELKMAQEAAAIIAIMIMAVLLFGFQTAIGNVQTLPSDMFSGKVVGTLSGFAGTAAKLAAFGLTALVPILTKGGNYTPAFLIGGALAVIALLAVWGLCSNIKPLKPKG